MEWRAHVVEQHQHQRDCVMRIVEARNIYQLEDQRLKSPFIMISVSRECRLVDEVVYIL